MISSAAECAQQLIRNVNYEIPALKQQIAKCQQTQRVRQNWPYSQAAPSCLTILHIKCWRLSQRQSSPLNQGEILLCSLWLGNHFNSHCSSNTHTAILVTGATTHIQSVVLRTGWGCNAYQGWGCNAYQGWGCNA